MAALFQSWRNQNRYRLYPFRDDASLVPSEDPGIVLPGDFIVDFSITVPVSETYGTVSADVAEVKLASMMYAEPTVALFFSLASGDSLASATISDLTAHVPGTSYPVHGVGEYDDVRGFIVLGDLDNFRNAVPAGAYTFSGAFFEMTTVRPVLRGVRSIRATSNLTDTTPLYGAVKLVAGNNVKLTVIPDENAIRIDALSTSGFSGDCECSNVNKATTVKSINGVSSENVELVGGQCVEVTKVGDTIMIKDTCSKPCCGCEELNLITDRLAYLETATSRIEAIANSMSLVIPSGVAAASTVRSSGGTIERREVSI